MLTESTCIISTYVVIRTERATFPFEIYVATLEAWPPGQHDTKIRPVASGADNFRTYKSYQLDEENNYY